MSRRYLGSFLRRISARAGLRPLRSSQGLKLGACESRLLCSAQTHTAPCMAGRRVRTFASSSIEDSGVGTPTKPSGGDESANARKDLYMMFTCGQCETRAMRGFSRQAYENGVVIVTCPGCQSKHVVADRMGWFGEPGSVEDFIAQKGEENAQGDGSTKVTRGSVKLAEGEDGTLEIDKEELEAWIKTFSSSKSK